MAYFRRMQKNWMISFRRQHRQQMNLCNLTFMTRNGRLKILAPLSWDLIAQTILPKLWISFIFCNATLSTINNEDHERREDVNLPASATTMMNITETNTTQGTICSYNLCLCLMLALSLSSLSLSLPS